MSIYLNYNHLCILFSLLQVKLFTDTLDKTMVEPCRQCHPLPFIELRKKAVAGIIYVTVISANKLSRSNLKGSPSRRQESSLIDGRLEECRDNNNLQTFVEVELEELTRRTSVGHGSSPKWDSTFNMSLHDDKGILKFNLYERNQGSVKYDYLTRCEIKVFTSVMLALVSDRIVTNIDIIKIRSFVQ